MNLREYQRLKAEVEAEFRRKIEAIETVWKISGGYGSLLAPQANPTLPNQNGLTRGSLQDAVRHAYKLLTGEFTHRDIYNQIVIFDPDFAGKIRDKMPSLSGALKRMVDDEELILVEAGRGKRPSRYRRPG